MPTICFCFGVSQEDIECRIETGKSLAEVCADTGMGWACGGCNRVTEPIWGDDATDASRERMLAILARRAELTAQDCQGSQ